MKSRRLSLAMTPIFAVGLAATIQYAHAQSSGTWTNNGSGNWSDPANWAGGLVAGGAGFTADFSTLNITTDNTVTLDMPVTLGTLSVQDATTASNNWTFTGSTLTLDNGASQPVLNLLNQVPVLSAPLAGSNGFSKLGAGKITLSGDNSGLSGTINLPNVTGTNNAGLNLASNTAIGNVTTINIGGTATTGQHLALTGEITLGPAVTINLNSQGGNNAPAGAIRAEGNATNVVTIQGPINVTLGGAASRIANNTAKRLDITGKIDGGVNGVTFRFGKNEGIHITNTGNTWNGTTVHSQETLWFDPGALPTTTNLQLCASDAGHVQTNGTFTRALGDLPNQVQFTASAGRAQGFGARGGALTLNFGGAGADLMFDTNAGAVASRIRTNTLVLNGATADSDITLVNPLDLNGAARSIQVSSKTATLLGGIKGGAFAVTKTSGGTLDLVTANTWTGDLNVAAGTRGNAGVVRLSHNEAIGPVSTVKNVNVTSSDQATSMIELPGGIAIDENKTLKMGGKFFYGNTYTQMGNQSSLRSIGTNAWAGSVLISTSGGSYGIESVSGTLTLGADPSTLKLMRNEVAGTSNRLLSWFGAGDVVMNLKMADNGTADMYFTKVGSGKLSITRSDNDFDQTPNLRSGVTEVVKLADTGTPSSLGTGLTTSGINVGATMRYIGTGDTCNRPLGILQTGATLDSSGTGALVLSSTTMTHDIGTASTACAPFAAGATSLLLNDPSGIAVGQGVTGTNIPVGTTVTAVDVDARSISLSQATSAASTTGLTMTFDGATALNRTLTLTGSNADDNTFAANLSDPGTGKLGITKTGTGKWILSGTTKANTGPLNVQAGTLGVSGPMPAGPVTVDAAATLSLNNAILAGSPALSIAGTLDLAGPVTIHLPNATGPGTYPILEYGALTGSGTISTVYRGASLNVGAGSASMTIGTGSALKWSGDAGNTWDVMTTPSWKNTALTPETFYFLDSVTFDENGAAQPSVEITQEVRPTSMMVINPTTDYAFSGSGFISGSGSLTKFGAAKLTLSTANTFSGGIQVLEGMLTAGHNQALGANGQIVTIASGAALDTAGALSVSRDYEAVIAGTGIGGSGAIVNTGGDHQSGFRALTLTGDATIGGVGRWDVRPVNAGTASINLDTYKLTKIGTNIIGFVDGAITGEGSIDVNEGILALTRMNVSGGGSINVNPGGVLRFENNTTGYYAKAIHLKGTDTQAATTLVTGANVTIDAPITLTNTGNIHVAATRTFIAAQPIIGSGALSVTSEVGTAGVLALQAENTYTGATTVDVGTLRIGNRTPSGSINALPVTLTNNANLQISRSDSYVFPNVIEGAGGVLIGANVAVTEPEYSSLVTLTGANTFTGGIMVYSGGLKIQNVAALGTGPKTINVGATGSAGTNGRPQFYLDGSAGNLTLPADYSFRTSSAQLAQPAIGNLAGDNAIEGTITLTAGGGSTAISVIGGSLALNGAISAANTGRFLILGGATGMPGTINGLISDGTNPLGLAMSGQNTWTLTNNNIYTGTTTVNSGVLLINGTQNLATGDVTVTGGTLGGTGTIGGNIAVQSAGTLAPGASVGTLTTVNSVILDGTLAVEVNGTTADKLAVGATLDIDGATLTVTPVGAGLTEPVYIIAQAGAPIIGNFAAVNVPGYTVAVNYNGLNQIALVGGTPYGTWESTNGIVGAGAGTDSDGDGIANGIEFVIGGDPSGPNSASNSLMPSITTDATYLNFVFRRSDVSAEYHPFVQYGTGLTGWAAAQNGTDGVIITEENDPFPGEPGIDRVTVRIPRSLAAPGSQLFARLRVEIP